jgi:hypothetical protein
MDENKENTKLVSKWKNILSLITLVFFIITIALLVYIVILYVPLREECLKCVCNKTVDIGINLSTTPSFP